MTDQPFYHYVIVRSDLPVGTIAAMIVHAAGEVPRAPPGTHAVVLMVKNEHDLKYLGMTLDIQGIAHHKVHEPDAPHHNALMAIGLYPQQGRQRALSGLPLFAVNQEKT
jgi:hypothetical protein